MESPPVHSGVYDRNQPTTPTDTMSNVGPSISAHAGTSASADFPLLAEYFSSPTLVIAVRRIHQRVNSDLLLTRSAAVFLIQTLHRIAERMLSQPHPITTDQMGQRIRELLPDEFMSRFLVHNKLNLKLVLPPLLLSWIPPDLRITLVGVLDNVAVVFLELGSLMARQSDYGLLMVRFLHKIPMDAAGESILSVIDKLDLKDEFLVHDTGAMLLKHFPQAQGIIKRINQRYAWYHDPVAVHQVLDRFLRGELEQGDDHYWRLFHIRPAAYLGRTSILMYVPISFPEPNPQPVDCAAFDLVDAAGREFPVLVEFRPGRPGVRCGGLIERHTGKILGTVELGAMAYHLNFLSSADDFFLCYTPHGFLSEHFKQLHPMQNQDGDIQLTRKELDYAFGPIMPGKLAVNHSVQMLEVMMLCCIGSTVLLWGPANTLHRSSVFGSTSLMRSFSNSPQRRCVKASNRRK